MKNRFFVINKEKIYAYVVSVMTIVVIFFMTNIMHTNFDKTEEVSASSNNSDNSAIGDAIVTTTSTIEDENTEQTVNKGEKTKKNEMNEENNAVLTENGEIEKRNDIGKNEKN